MSDWQLKTPVAFFVFNRLDTTERVFEEIRKAKPPILLVVADGSRPDRPDEAMRCEAVRAIIERVDWECKVLKNYSDVNLGCKYRVSSGLDWVFENVEQVIILEDDCLPHSTFFRFCEELLEKYRDDERIMAISGDNFQFGRKRTEYSYYFSRYNHCWGWASWSRAWRHYEITMSLWPEIREGVWLKDMLCNPEAVKYWKNIFEITYKDRINSWDYQWTFACWIQGGLSILPNVNLASNIGFGEEATHTKSKSRLANMPVDVMTFPLQHPPYMIRDNLADEFTQKNHFGPPNLIARVKSKARTLFTKLQQ